MKYIFFISILFTQIFASFDFLESFEADFIQNITDEKNKTLKYNGHIIAKKPQQAVWNYTKPVPKKVYISKYSVVIVEPEIEQAIIKRLKSNFDFFNIIKNAKKISKNEYIATHNKTDFKIVTNGKLLESISYKDEFDNKIIITFKNQKHNIKLDKMLFIPDIPIEFDVIRD